MSPARASAVIQLLRPSHWVKNSLVGIPALLSGGFSAVWDPTLLTAIIAFCLLSSSVYAFNDLVDMTADRNHPVKKLRPVAAGALNRHMASVLSLTLAVVALFLATRTGAFGLFLLYLVVNVAYSLGVKRVPYAELLSVASGFALRVWLGLVLVPVAELDVLPWLLLTGAIGLVAAKRYAEKQTGLTETRAVLRSYHPATLRSIIVTSLALVVVLTVMWVLEHGAASMLASGLLLTATLTAVIRVGALALSTRLESSNTLITDPISAVSAVCAALGVGMLLVG